VLLIYVNLLCSEIWLETASRCAWQQFEVVVLGLGRQMLLLLLSVIGLAGLFCSWLDYFCCCVFHDLDVVVLGVDLLILLHIGSESLDCDLILF